jgi:hypothetical protein
MLTGQYAPRNGVPTMLPIWMSLDMQLQVAMREANAAPQNVVWQEPRPAG